MVDQESKPITNIADEINMNQDMPVDVGILNGIEDETKEENKANKILPTKGEKLINTEGVDNKESFENEETKFLPSNKVNQPENEETCKESFDIFTTKESVDEYAGHILSNEGIENNKMKNKEAAMSNLATNHTFDDAEDDICVRPDIFTTVSTADYKLKYESKTEKKFVRKKCKAQEILESPRNYQKTMDNIDGEETGKLNFLNAKESTRFFPINST